MNFTGAKVIVTGGLGFIGSNLALALVNLGAKVTLVDSLIPEYGGNLFNIHSIKDKLSVNISDVRDEHSLKYLIQDQDFLFNLAGQTSHLDSMQNPFIDLEINSKAQLSILEACRHYNRDIRIIFASTRQVYGTPQYLPVDEKHPLLPVDVNGINKLSGEWYHLLYHNVYGIPCSVIRLTNTYGPRMRIKDARQTFLGTWIKKILSDETFQIFGEGKQLRDFNYVEDVVTALLRLALSDEASGQVYNLGASDYISLLDLADLLVRSNNNSGNYQIVEFPPNLKRIDIGDYYADFKKINEKISWVPETQLEEGLKATLEYFRANLSQYI